MSKPVVYSVLIRDGQKRPYEIRWANLFRELMWGPEAFEAWLSEGEESEYEPEELSGIAIVNFDSRELRWGEREVLEIPRVKSVHRQLLEQVWPGFTISFLSKSEMYQALWDRSDEDEEETPDDRPETVREAAGLYDEEETEDADGEETGADFDDEDPRAWLTIIDQKGKMRHRNLESVSLDLLSFNKTAMQQLAKLKPAEVPSEKVVTEGMWIDLKNKRVGFWGGSNAKRDFRHLQKGWQGWNVQWAEDGYVSQCEASHQPGMPMTDTDALAQFIPAVLSTKPPSLGEVFGVVGGQLKKKVMQGVGCLIVALAIPILLIGYFIDRLKESGGVVVAVVVLVLIAFKVIESKIKGKFAKFTAEESETETRP
ncbi:MAG: hypothetical protein KDA52_09795, partial [Planctomycetaceae bacterium]|nr:hypothetical protein [Planctomycetaceae bacterium]